MRYVCVHGHFYQPPRENPSLEAIELQDSAYPYHDWNERMTAECYAPNATSRILDDQQRIVELVNNYAQISFNFGPTLLSWMEDKAPSVSRRFCEADNRAQQQIWRTRFGDRAGLQPHDFAAGQPPRQSHPGEMGHCAISSIASGANRKACGCRKRPWTLRRSKCWPNTGSDSRFSLRDRRSACAAMAGASWKDVTGDRIDPSRAYLANLPSKKTISVFFYDGPISQAVAFEGLLNDGQRFADRLVSGFSDSATGRNFRTSRPTARATDTIITSEKWR